MKKMLFLLLIICLLIISGCNSGLEDYNFMRLYEITDGKDGINISDQLTLNNGSACIMIRDSDNNGWTKCNALNGSLVCIVDLDGIC